MFNHRQELLRRTSQFVGYLKNMHHRAHVEAYGSCFIIFEEQPPQRVFGDRALSETATPARERLISESDCLGFDGLSVTQEDLEINLPDEGWRDDNSRSRFIQFSMERNWFCLDMPLQTLFRGEAEQILRSRRGFFYLRDRPEFTLHGEDVDGYDPFRKIYIYGDEESAAEDMASIFFQVWRFPVDWRFYVTAAAFGASTDWERGVPVE
jgi:hypothetical protein